MSGKTGKILKWGLIVLAGLVVIALIAGGLYWNHLLNLLGDADQTVPTLSYEEEMALLGETEVTEPMETTVPEETMVMVLVFRLMEQRIMVSESLFCSSSRQFCPTSMILVIYFSGRGGSVSSGTVVSTGSVTSVSPRSAISSS